MPRFPAGAVTFLFTGIERGTPLGERGAAAALAAQRTLRDEPWPHTELTGLRPGSRRGT